MHAAERGHKELVELLLENKADIEAKDKYGYTVLELCCPVMSEFIRCLPTGTKRTIGLIIDASNIPCDGDIVPKFSQSIIEGHYKKLQGGLAKAHADLIYQNLFAKTVKTTETILTAE